LCGTVQLIEIELSKAYLRRALRCKDSDSVFICCLAQNLGVTVNLLHWFEVLGSIDFKRCYSVSVILYFFIQHESHCIP